MIYRARISCKTLVSEYTVIEDRTTRSRTFQMLGADSLDFFYRYECYDEWCSLADTIRVQGRLKWLKSYRGQQNPPRSKTRTTNNSGILGASASLGWFWI